MKTPAARKHRVLIINAYLDPWREATPSRVSGPRPMAPFFLAGHFNSATCDVRVWDEFYHGVLLDRTLFAWPDMVIFTGLTAAFDRARQLNAYFRHARPGVITVIGGPLARALPGICEAVFDYVCQGDVEEIVEVIDATLGATASMPEGAPRNDLMAPTLGLRYAETTKYCNFACAFCALTGEGRPYTAYSTAAIERQLDAIGRTRMLVLSDNNFFGNNRRSFQDRAKLLGERVRRGQFSSWGCLVTADFFAKSENIKLLAENGCRAIFAGVETLDPKVLDSYQKRHSLVAHPRRLTEICAEHGILFDYGMMLDFTQQTMAEITEQIESLLADHRSRLPAFFSTTIPIVGTPYFDESAKAGRILPNVLLSDMDGLKIVEHPREPLEEVAQFLGDVLNMRRWRGPAFRHALRHVWHWRKHLPTEMAAMSVLLSLTRHRRRRGFGSIAQMRMSFAEERPTYIAPRDPLRHAYRPIMPLPSGYEKDFQPLRITDETGALTDMFEAARARPAQTPLKELAL